MVHAETYWTGTITANYVDQDDLKIAWMYTSVGRHELITLDDGERWRAALADVPQRQANSG